MKAAKKIYFFLAGVFLAFDFTGLIGLNLLQKTPEQKRKTDAENLASDWEKVGFCIRGALDETSKKYSSK